MTCLVRTLLRITDRILFASALLTFAFFAPTSMAAQRGRPVIRRPAPPPIRVTRKAAPIFLPFPQRFPLFALGPDWNFQSRWFPGCGIFPGYRCNPVPLYYPPPSGYYGESYIQRPQLALKDGTIYSVSDYWLRDNQLHFKTLEEGGAKSVERIIDFDQLDVQKSIDLDAQRGFRFVLRNEPIDQYIIDHPELGAPHTPTP